MFSTHGEPRAAQALGELIKQELGWNVVVPQFGEVVRFAPNPDWVRN